MSVEHFVRDEGERFQFCRKDPHDILHLPKGAVKCSWAEWGGKSGGGWGV